MSRDLYAEVTNKILEQMETAKRWEKPWTFGNADGSTLARPVNLSGKPYRGINVPLLWSAGYSSVTWGTYKAWSDRGCQVRKGERGTTIVFWKLIERTAVDAAGEDKAADFMMARAYCVFNSAQVDGYEAEPVPVVSEIERNARADAFIDRTGAVVRTGGDRAFFTPGGDFIQMPPQGAFKGSSTSSAIESYYGTLLHELTHWSGAEKRCNRVFGQRFGDLAYAMEELVAELGSAYLSADLGITNTPRPDHASYLASWIKTLKNDKRAIFTAASKAEAACKFLGIDSAEEDDSATTMAEAA